MLECILTIHPALENTEYIQVFQATLRKEKEKIKALMTPLSFCIWIRLYSSVIFA